MSLSFAEVATADAETLLAAAPELCARPPTFEDWRVLARALAALAADLGIESWALPQLEIIHAENG